MSVLHSSPKFASNEGVLDTLVKALDGSVLTSKEEHGEIIIGTVNPDPEHLTLRVSDNGTGISKEDLPHIFEPFFSTKRETSGIGLGLSIVHGIVENHKGQIEVKSEPGQGTSIEITLPLTEV